MPSEKTMSQAKVAYSLALLCLTEGVNDDTLNPFGLKPLHKEIELSEFKDRGCFLVEAIYLACFAVDYGTAVVLGQNNRNRKSILEISRLFIMRALGPPADHIFADGLNQRLTIYAVAYHRGLELQSDTDEPATVPILIGEAFNMLDKGSTTDDKLAIKAGVHFCVIMDAVIKFLRSITIV